MGKILYIRGSKERQSRNNETEIAAGFETPNRHCFKYNYKIPSSTKYFHIPIYSKVLHFFLKNVFSLTSSRWVNFITNTVVPRKTNASQDKKLKDKWFWQWGWWLARQMFLWLCFTRQMFSLNLSWEAPLYNICDCRNNHFLIF